MSRSLGKRAMHKARAAAVSPEAQGREAFIAGAPKTACPYFGSGHGKAHAWERGWNRARTEAQAQAAHKKGMK